VTLRRARLCDDAEKTRAGFDLHEKSHLSTVAVAGVGGLSVGKKQKNHSLFLDRALPFKIPVASLSAFRNFSFRIFEDSSHRSAL